MSDNRLTVHVQDHAQQPLTGVKVTVAPAGARTREGLEDVGAGRYEAGGLDPGPYTLRLAKRGFETDEYELTVRPGANSAYIVLGRKGQPYYWADQRKIYFEPVHNQMLLAVQGDAAAETSRRVLADRRLGSESAFKKSVEVPDSCFLCIDLPEDEDSLAPVTIDAAAREIAEQGLEVVPARIVRRGDAPVQGLTNELTVGFEDGISEDQITAIAAAHGLQVRRPVRSAGNAYLLTTGSPPSYDLLDTARELLEQEGVTFAEPDLLMELEIDLYTPNDTLFNLLDHLLLINCDDAWEILGEFDVELRGGSPEICIAVFDPHGVAANHPDLTANLTNGNSKLLTSFNFRVMAAQTVAGLGGDHGTECAGTATAAFDNNRGIAGVAPNCRLIGARLPSPATGVAMADAFLWAAGIDNGSTDPNFPALPAQPADVISNSWGASGAALSTALRNAFDRLTDEGRDGKGCVVTFSTGNLGYTQFSNVRTFAAYDRTLAVGASINSNPTSPVNSFHADPNGNTNNIAVTVDTRALYNPFGPEMDIVAPSHTCYAASGGALVDPTTSTVRVGTGALDGCPGAAVCKDYDTSFGGTSHASPTIAGTAALILSANPLLAWHEVRDILRRTAVRIDAGNTNAIGQYVDNDGDEVDEFSQWYGYGRVDVAAAVREALLLYVAQQRLLAETTRN